MKNGQTSFKRACTGVASWNLIPQEHRERLGISIELMAPVAGRLLKFSFEKACLAIKTADQLYSGHNLQLVDLMQKRPHEK